jgi:hypothetical protein
MITPTFHLKILEDYLEVFSEKSEILVKQLQKEIGFQRFDIYPYIYRCALDIICGEFFLLPSFQHLETIVVSQNSLVINVSVLKTLRQDF